MKKLIVSLRYYLLYTSFFLLSLFPLRVLYFFSDTLFYIIYYVVGYRKKVVRNNLTRSFPEKTEEEIIRIEKEFYSMLCDYFLEMAKMTTLSEKELKRRLIFEGFEPVIELLNSGHPVGVYMSHTFNWEWVASMPIHVAGCNPNVVFAQIYHRLANKAFDRLMYKIRGRFGAESIAMPDTARAMMHYRKDGRVPIIGFIADQAPKLHMIDHWVNFLQQDTPVITGTERLLKRLSYGAAFASLIRVKRGYYVFRMEKLIPETSSMPNYELTDLYYAHLEESIRRNPASWLWSHKRWKRTREQYETYKAEHEGGKEHHKE